MSTSWQRHRTASSWNSTAIPPIRVGGRIYYNTLRLSADGTKRDAVAPHRIA